MAGRPTDVCDEGAYFRFASAQGGEDVTADASLRHDGKSMLARPWVRLTLTAGPATIAIDMTSARREPAPLIVWSLMAPFAMMAALGLGFQVDPPDPGGPTAIEQALMEH